ncbi:hypothetical protein LOC71_08400 [Rhodopirellula sp. JC740]|uniref:MarR family transcriptional regulator n=1 Tax=Rhodopirellula halodulae TaxID=2894198 RepID=A0ABS8NH75_9BACT|nr:hypothetical protein [Rhodopirellula sp. JC740]MCC9642292.1 hypothetical protein [Rhodopirellula sp. JC740]
MSRSDAELLLCEFLWQHTVMTRGLSSEVYLFHMNVGYSHGLTGPQLHATLHRMHEREFIAISSDVDDAESSVTLTPLGREQ